MFEKFTKYALYVGLNDKNTKKQEIETHDAINDIQDMFSAVSVSIIYGAYTHDETKVKETTLKIEIIDFAGDTDITNTIYALKSAFNQEKIAVEKYEILSALI